MSEVMMWFERGGIQMYPLLLSSIVAVWIFLERLYHLKRAGGKADAIYDAVKVLVLEGKRQAAIDRARKHPGPVAAVFRAVLDTSFTERSELEEVALIQGKKELQRLSRRLPLLSLIVGIAPAAWPVGDGLGFGEGLPEGGRHTGHGEPKPPGWGDLGGAVDHRRRPRDRHPRRAPSLLPRPEGENVCFSDESLWRLADSTLGRD